MQNKNNILTQQESRNTKITGFVESIKFPFVHRKIKKIIIW